jgi:hypothetical protein
MATAGLHRLIYRSTAAILGTTEQVEAEIASILESSHRNNGREDLTGVLLHASGSFTQVLEGSVSAIERVYDRISADLRHSALDIVQFVPVLERRFEVWSMAYVRQEALTALWNGRGATSGEEAEAMLDMLASLLWGAPRGEAVPSPHLLDCLPFNPHVRTKERPYGAAYPDTLPQWHWLCPSERRLLCLKGMRKSVTAWPQPGYSPRLHAPTPQSSCRASATRRLSTVIAHPSSVRCVQRPPDR